MSKIAPPATRSSAPKRLPLSALLALATSGFLTVMLETLPAGVLPALSRDLGVEEGTAGQAVTLYALGALLGAIPIISATMGWPRRRLLVIALSGYVLTSLIVAVSPVFAVTLAARFIAGVFAGTLWGILAGYVGRIVDPTQRGRALTIGLSGTPIALAFGTPAGTLLASAIGWRLTFVTMAVITAAVVLWVLAAVPPLPGQERHERTTALQALRVPGVLPIIAVALLFFSGHALLYTYIAPFLALTGLGGSVSAMLLVFGVSALVGLWATGLLIDRHLRLLMLISTAVLALAVLVLGLATSAPIAVTISIVAWGIAFGGSGSLQQTALTNASGTAVDAAQSVLVTGLKLGIAAGGALGGLVLSGIGAGSLPFATLVLIVLVLVIVAAGRRHAFPARQLTDPS
ncbi:MFS transporter [Curtobacterium flaccumfaciens]|uniref:MFS transporter n=1 Tax=Curtobacterium flaccumfaciens TaxID=2035 RepID=UPI00188CB81C|nr:MFS transporter [Curtobacterium flaccumfaciens]MBF4594879.1 MFS transporter [Curtobacterium flaccumfaciens]